MKSKRTVLNVSYGPKDGPNFGLGIHRASLFEALLDVVTANGIKITKQHRVAATHTNDQGRFVSFENGETLGPFDLVVNTTGARSPISPLVSKPLPYGAIWSTVNWPENCTLQYDRLQQRYRRASNMIGIPPIRTLPGEDQPKAALFWSLPRTEIDAWREAPIEQWRDQATTLWPELAPFTDQITDQAQMTAAVGTHASLRKPFSDRLIHVGDAAHRASPQLGQGVNMALLDAAALVKCLETYPIDQALPKYVQARRLHTNTYQAMS